jgi:hypothetical protein
MQMGVGGRNTSQPRSNHNDTDSSVYYVQLGRISTTTDVSRNIFSYGYYNLITCTATSALKRMDLLNCRAHMETIRRGSNMGQMTDTQLETQHYQQFCNWYRDYVRKTIVLIIISLYLEICFSLIFVNINS